MVLPDSTEVDLGTLGRARVTGLLGQGGQGYVYEVRRDDGLPLALKWYRPEIASDVQFREIQTLVEFGSPHIRFLWPLSLAKVNGDPGFGYVMQLRDDTFLELGCLLTNEGPDGNSLDVSFSSTITMCRQLGFSFRHLHALGLCYRDISFGNVFFEPSTGDILICDNDNVGIDNGTSRVLGTPFFMAPEVVADRFFETLPNTDTDRHSLAVLLFYILFTGHPLEGARTETGLRDPAWLLRHFGTDPLFCMHPDNDENRPSDVVQQYWELYPQFLRDVFVQAFVEGLTQPARRVTEGQWIKAMDRLLDGLVRCEACDTTGFWDTAEPDKPCRSCGRLLRPPFVLEIGRRKVAVSPLATIRTDHVGSGIDESKTLGKVRAHPTEPDRWGLTNVSEASWTALYAGDHQVTHEPGSTIELSAGLRIHLESTVVKVLLP